MKNDRRCLAADLLLGAAAGAAAALVMDKATTFMYEREPQRAREQENHARQGKTAYVVAAEKAAAMAGRDLSDEQRSSYGAAIHRGLGVGSGALYATLRHWLPAAARGGGTLFGTGMWLATDEVGTAALGLTPGPTSFPWQTHARGLVGHLIFGLVLEAGLDAVDRLL